ncbi:MAG: hypothetical protein ABSD38_24540 [Syntrophorhabdales bacterium]|jgi:hypothetical protein
MTNCIGFKKLIVTSGDNAAAVLRELLIEHVNPEETRTLEVLRERSATPHEVLLYHTGYGWMLQFDRPNPGGFFSTPTDNVRSNINQNLSCLRRGK